MGEVEEDASFIARAPHREKIMRRLIKGPAMPAQIRNDTGQEYSRISESIKDLEEQNLVELLVDKDTKRGRLYSVTDRGEAAWEWMVENDIVADNG